MASTVEVRIPRSLQGFWQAPSRLSLRGDTLADVFKTLAELEPGLAARILDDQGRVRQHVGVFVNSGDVRDREPGQVPLRSGDVVDIIGAVSGG
jgi:molybdopterin converting factor small subunit